MGPSFFLFYYILDTCLPSLYLVPSFLSLRDHNTMKTLRIVSQLRDEEPYLPEVGKASVAAAPTTTTTTTSDRRTRSSNAATSKKLQRQQRQQQQQQNNNNGALDQLVYQSNRDVVAVAAHTCGTGPDESIKF